MKKRIFIITILLLTLFINIFSIQDVFADEHKLEKLDIDVFINNDGSAKIVETRKVNLIQETENFIIIGNLGKSTIKDFRVKEDGIYYKYIENWDIDASKEEKTYKNSIINKGDSYDLVWGIGEYGEHEYIVEYIVTDFIKELQDSQILFWRFINDKTNIPPEKVTVTIESETPMSEEEEKVWAFGYNGNIKFEDGKVLAKALQAFKSNEYMTILLKFPEKIFATKDYIDKPFKEIKEKAFQGSDYGIGKESKSILEKLKDFILPLFVVILPIIAILFFIFKLLQLFRNAYQAPRKFRRRTREEYVRKYPYKGDFLDIYYIPYNIGASNFENLLTSFILKWIKNGNITTKREELGLIKKSKQTNIKFLNRSIKERTLEGKLFFMLLHAANKEDILEEKRFIRWAKINRRKIKDWEKEVRNQSIEKLEKKGYIEVKEKRKHLFKVKDITLTKSGKELEKDIYKYINYLYDFSLLNEKDPINVKLWDDIMILASSLGATNVVRTQFRKLYPKYESETVYIGSAIYATKSFIKSVGKVVTPSTSARSSGGGGFSSSGGGGGGSFGGGSGGGTR